MFLTLPQCGHFGRRLLDDGRGFCLWGEDSNLVSSSDCLNCPVRLGQAGNPPWYQKSPPAAVPVDPSRILPCVHRGALLREERCLPCGGSKTVGVHKCAVFGFCSTNRYAAGQKEASCVSCSMREEPPAVTHLITRRWAYGVITTPARALSHLPKTIASLRASGFDRPILFVDGAGDTSPYHPFQLPTVVRTERRGNFGNWWLSAQEIYNSDPTADFYAIFEDDLAISRGARAYLERTCDEDECYYNLYTFPDNQRRVMPEYHGWFDSNQKGLGAVGLVFRRETFIKLLSSKAMLYHPLDAARGKQNVDGAILTAMAGAGVIERCHSPSIVQHVGDVSTIGNGSWPKAETFQGEEFDLMSLYLSNDVSAATPALR